MERRVISASLEVRDGTDDRPCLEGYAAVFGQRAAVSPYYTEQIKTGAFASSIQTDDIRALWNHNPDFVLGRNRSGTLQLSEDEHGLKVTIYPPNTSYANDLMESIRRGDVSQMSFGFVAERQSWNETDPKHPVRSLEAVKLYDVSPVTYPAYPTTDIGLRCSEDIYNDYLQQRQAAAGDIGRDQAVIDIRRKKLQLIGG